MAQVKIVTTPYSDKDKKKPDHSYIAGMDIKWYSRSGKQFGSFLTIETRDDHMTQQSRFWAFISEK